MIKHPAPETASELLIGCTIGAFTLTDVRSWASDELGECWQDEERFLLSDLLKLPDLQAVVHSEPSTLRALVSIREPGFDPTGQQAADYAKRIWIGTLERYVIGEGEPDDVCHLHDHIEPNFDFPEWLGNMYNACDWAANDRSLSPQIEEEARAILSTFGPASGLPVNAP